MLNQTPAEGPLPQPELWERDPWEWILTYLACLTVDPDGPSKLLKVQLGSFSDPTAANLIDNAICLRGSTPSSFYEIGSPPGWLRCDGTLDPFGVAQNGATSTRTDA